VIDGDTIEIHGTRIRLHGIDAPESRQLCKMNGEAYRCGQRAAFALSDLLGALYPD
jgi:endonuclease YncB( thermonuclease family)